MSLISNYFSEEFLTSIITLVDADPFYNLAPSVTVHAPRKRMSSSKLIRSLQQVFHAFNTLRKSRNDVCVIFGEDIAGILCPIARLAGVPRVIVLNRGNPERSLRGILRWINPVSYRMAECVVVQTKQAVDILKSLYGKCCFQVIANPISIPDRVPPVAERPKQVIYVASIGRDKNQIGLLKIFSKLKVPKDWNFVFVGDGPDRPKLEALVGSLGMKNRVQLLGQRTDVAELLQDSQVFAFPSLSEGFPNALAEALAAGCACISYDCLTGPRDLITDGVNGILIPTGDEAAFVEKLQTLIKDESLRTFFSEQARNRINQFDSRKILADFRRLIAPDTRS